MANSGFISATQAKSAFDRKGNLTAEAKNDLKKLMFESVFRGGNAALAEKFARIPVKTQNAILATAWRDNNSPDSQRMNADLQESIEALYELMNDPNFVKSKDMKDILRSTREWEAMIDFDTATGDPVQRKGKYSNFALRLAATYKAYGQKAIESILNRIYDLVQGKAEATFFEAADDKPRTLAEAVKEVLNIEYDGKNRGNLLGSDTTGSEEGRKRIAGDTPGGEQAASGERRADGGAGTASILGPERGVAADNAERGGANGAAEVAAERQAQQSAGAVQDAQQGGTVPASEGRAAEEADTGAHPRGRASQEQTSANASPNTGSAQTAQGRLSEGYQAIERKIADDSRQLSEDFDRAVQGVEIELNAPIPHNGMKRGDGVTLSENGKRAAGKVQVAFVGDDLYVRQDGSRTAVRYVGARKLPASVVLAASERDGSFNHLVHDAILQLYRDNGIELGFTDKTTRTLAPRNDNRIEAAATGSGPADRAESNNGPERQSGRREPSQGRPEQEGTREDKSRDGSAGMGVIDVINQISDDANNNQDGQGNPLNADGSLKVEAVSSIDDLTDEDFTSPTRNVQLPELPKNVAETIGTDGKPVVIKKNILKRNTEHHPDVSPSQSREILKAALYTPDLYGQNQRTSHPYNWALISVKGEDGRNKLVLLEVNHNKDFAEIVHWHFVEDRAIEKIKKQAEREGGQLLILPSVDTEEAGALPGRPSGSASESKGTQSPAHSQETGHNTSSTRNGLRRRNFFTLRLMTDEERAAAREQRLAEEVQRKFEQEKVKFKDKNPNVNDYAAVLQTSNNIAEAVAKFREQARKCREEAEDWRNRVYKKNAHKVIIGEKAEDLDVTVRRIDVINENRRYRNIRALLKMADEYDEFARTLMKRTGYEDEMARKEREVKAQQDARRIERMRSEVAAERQRRAEEEVANREVQQQASEPESSQAQTGQEETREDKPRDEFPGMGEIDVINQIAEEASKKQDSQGNPLNADGSLKVEAVSSIDEITDEDFTEPTRNVQLPNVPENVAAAIGTNGKPVVIKKSIFEKNSKSHKDLTPDQSREILQAALYNADLYGQNKKASKPYNWILIHLNDDRNSAVLIEVANEKDRAEIVNWHYLRDGSLRQKERQAIKEGGLILALPDKQDNAAGDASDNLPSGDKGSKESSTTQEKQPASAENALEQPASTNDNAATTARKKAEPQARQEQQTSPYAPKEGSPARQYLDAYERLEEAKRKYSEIKEKIAWIRGLLLHSPERDDSDDKASRKGRYNGNVYALTKLANKLKATDPELAAYIEMELAKHKKDKDLSDVITWINGHHSDSKKVQDAIETLEKEFEKTFKSEYDKLAGELRNASAEESNALAAFYDAIDQIKEDYGEGKISLGDVLLFIQVSARGQDIYLGADLKDYYEAAPEPFVQGNSKHKFDIHSFCAGKAGSKIDALRGVHYSNGTVVASDGKILVQKKENYPAEKEGKTVDKKGSAIENEYPDVQSILPKDISGLPSVDFDAADMEQWCSAAVEQMKQARQRAQRKISAVYDISSTVIKVGDRYAWYSTEQLYQFAQAAVEIGATKLYMYEHFGVNALYTESDKGRVILMPNRDEADSGGLGVYSYKRTGEFARFNIGQKKSAAQNRTAHSEKAIHVSGVSGDALTKVRENLETLALAYEKRGNSAKGLISDLSKALQLEQRGASNYGSFMLPGGRVVTLRISNHNANVELFDANGETEGISIVVTNRKDRGLQGDGVAHVVEFFYSKRALERAGSQSMVDIIRSLEETLETGIYIDATGIAHVDEANAPILDAEFEGETGSAATSPQPLPVEAIRDVTADMQEKFGTEAEVIESLDDVQDEEARKRIAAGDVVEGWYDPKTGKVYLYAPNIESEQDAMATYAHEVIAHKGMEGLLGKERYKELCERLGKALTSEQRKKVEAYEGSNDRTLGDEYIARILTLAA